MTATENKYKKLKLGAFVAVLYSYCAAGPFGFEDIVSAAGPGMALVFLFFVPLFYSLPVSLVTAEMASALPVEGGFYRWTLRVFGPFIGFQCGWWNWIGTFLMNAAYAVILADYTGGIYPALAKGAPHWWVAVFFLLIVMFANIRGVHVVGVSSIILLVLCLAPVAVFTLLGLTHMQVNPFQPFIPSTKTWQDIFGVGLALGLWVYSGYEQLSTNIEEVEEPEKNFARGLMIMVPLAMLTFFLPMLAGIGAGHWQQWTSGYIVTAARSVGEFSLGAGGGVWLERTMFFAAIVSVLLGLQSTLMSSTRLPFTMAEDGFFPEALAKLNTRYQTPVRSIVMTTVLCAALSVFSVTELVAIYIWLRVASSSLTLLAFWRLRVAEPQLARSYRVPGGNAGMYTVVFIPLLLFAWFLYNSDSAGRLWGPICLFTGPLAYFIIGYIQNPKHLETR